MHEDFIQVMVYQPLPKGHPTYGFHFLGRYTQTLWRQGLELCFEADRLFSRCNHHHYRGQNRETQAATVWHRETAALFCTDAFWENLQENARDDEACFVVATLQAEHNSHRLFLHHTTESLLYVAKTILPPLQKALQQAQKMLKRWSWLPWVPNAFVRHYDAYLTSTQEKLEEIEQQLIQAIKARVELVLQSKDGKTGDVILSLIAKLRQEVPGFISDERLRKSETPLSQEERWQGKKQLVLPVSDRQVVTLDELSKVVYYLYECKETRAFVLDYLGEVNEVVDAALPLTVKDAKGRLLLLPSGWQSQDNVSWSDIIKAYPWCRDWTLEEGLALLQLNTRLKMLMGEDKAHVALTKEELLAQLDLMGSVMRTSIRLARYQKKMSEYQPRGFWFRFFATWEKTVQYHAWKSQQQQLTELMKKISEQQTQWLLEEAPRWIANKEVYSPKQWIEIIRVARAVTLPRLKEHVEGNPDPKILLLHTTYQRLRIASSPFLAGEEKVEKYLRGEEACTLQTVKILLSTRTSISQDQWSMIEKWRGTLKEEPLLLTDWQAVLKPLLAELHHTWCRFLKEGVDGSDLIDCAAKETYFRQCTELLTWWCPNFRKSHILQAKATLEKRYRVLSPENINAQDLLQRLNRILDSAFVTKSGNPFNDDDALQQPMPRSQSSSISSNNPFAEDCKKEETLSGNPFNDDDALQQPMPRSQSSSTSSNNPFAEDCKKEETLQPENTLSTNVPREPTSITTISDASDALKQQEETHAYAPTTSEPMDAFLQTPPTQHQPSCVSSLPSQVVVAPSDRAAQELSTKISVTTPPPRSATTASLHAMLDPSLQKWVEDIKQGLLTHQKICSHHGKHLAVNNLLSMAEKMAREGGVDVTTWPGRFQLDRVLQRLLSINTEPRPPSFWDRLLSSEIPYYVPEFRFVFNLVACLYQWNKSTSEREQQQQVLLYSLSGLENIVKTPALLEVCRKLFTELQNRTFAINVQVQRC